MRLNLLVKKLLFNSFIVVFVLQSLTLFSASEQYQLGLSLSGFNGLTIASPTTLHENPNNILHTQTTLITLSPEIPEDIIITASTNPLQCTVSSPALTLGFTGTGTSSGTIAFAAINDGIAEPTNNLCLVTYTVSSLNALYNGTFTSVISIVDYNPFLIINSIKQVDENPLSVTHSHQLQLTLSEQPSDIVSFVVSLNNSQLDTVLTSVSFTPLNWNVIQYFSYSADNDGVPEPTPHYSLLQFTASSISAPEFANKSYFANIPITDFTISIPVIVRTGALQILPILAFASFVLILVYFFVTSNR